MSLVRRLFEGGGYLKAVLILRTHTTAVTGNRKREVGLVIPAKFTAFTQELKNAKILKRELNERASRYTYFELKKHHY